MASPFTGYITVDKIIKHDFKTPLVKSRMKISQTHGVVLRINFCTLKY
jgi:hypothetical protein